MSYEDLLDQVAAIRERKLFNALLAILQMPHASMLCTASDWKSKWGRRIAPEQRPLVLLFPFGPVEFVFDLTQTEPTDQARPLPINAAPFAMEPFARAGEMVARLSAALIESGVRVLTARQGVSLAGRIRRTEGDTSQEMPGRKQGEPGHLIPVRWVVALNESHSPTEQLATLCHEIGHLYCGHVGADQGDPWPCREVPPKTQEFEAESVARLVFRRIAPGAELPPYLEHIVGAGEPLLEPGWTSIAQAADMILDSLGAVSSSLAPPGIDERPSSDVGFVKWASDLTIRRGGPSSLELVLIADADEGPAEWSPRLFSTWSAVELQEDQPWVALAHSAAALEGVLAYFKHPPGEDSEHDLYMAQVESILPIADLSLTVIRLGDANQEALVEIEIDPPNSGGEVAFLCVQRLNEDGVAAVELPLETGWMYTWHSPADDIGWSEQVLDWTDMYTDAQWRYLSEANRLFVNLRPSADLWQEGRVETIAKTISLARREIYDYYVPDEVDGDDGVVADSF